MKEYAIETTDSISAILDAVVSINTQISDDALSADLLGAERSGHGVVIREDGLILTIGYLVIDADRIWIGTDGDTAVPGHVIACDFESGLGLVKPSMPVNLPSVEPGSAASLEINEPVFVLGSGGIDETIEARVIGKQEFAGRWEYLLEDAVYTSPAHTSWAGAALLNGRGRLCGIGSLLVQIPDAEASANLFVPVDCIESSIDDLCRYGRRNTPPLPWLGMLIHDEENLQVAAVYGGCPAEQAGLEPGDIIIAVDGVEAESLADFYRKLRACGPAGTRVALTVERSGELIVITVISADRNAFLKKDTIN
ncbi:MAG: S1C family serine protease [Gammaproteobacteria bacterium]